MRLGWMIIALLAWGCQRPCDASTCDGCCTDLGECTSGSSRTTCGKGGELCTSCASSERCELSRCVKQTIVDAGVMDAGPVGCSCATSCCLPDGSCAPNNQIDACGRSGVACGTCRTDQRCERGLCVSTSCNGCFDALGTCNVGSADSACGLGGTLCQACSTDQRCSGGTCIYDHCDLTNCRFGCCLPNRRCETQISPAACGFNASRCVQCGDGGTCIGGLCQ